MLVRCVYEASDEDPRRTIGAKINWLMTFDTMFPEVIGQFSEWKRWRSGEWMWCYF